MKTWIIERTNGCHLEIKANFMTIENSCLLFCNESNLPENRGFAIAAFGQHIWSSVKIKKEDVNA